MERFLVASKNKDKIHEIKEILAGFPFEIVGMESIGIHTDIVEDADSFEGNALIKAKTIQNQVGGYVMADDSGLCIDALDGAPGVQSARYMGHETSYEIKNAAILDLLRDVPEERRGAQFVCAVAAVLPDGSDHVETGVMEGQVAYEVSGNGGFGYDPLFYLPEYGMTSADITEEQKNAISHRGKALRQMMVYLAGEGLCEY